MMVKPGAAASSPPISGAAAMICSKLSSTSSIRLDRQPRLACTAWPGEGDQPCAGDTFGSGQHGAQRDQLMLPPNEDRTLGRQVVRSAVQAAQRRELGGQVRRDQLKHLLGAQQV